MPHILLRVRCCRTSRSLFKKWSGWWESNPHDQLGRLVFYHWTTPAYLKRSNMIPCFRHFVNTFSENNLKSCEKSGSDGNGDFTKAGYPASRPLAVKAVKYGWIHGGGEICPRYSDPAAFSGARRTADVSRLTARYCIKAHPEEVISQLGKLKDVK